MMRQKHAGQTSQTPRCRLQRQAADWLMRVQAGDVTEQDLMEWEAWLKADARHQRAFDELEQLSSTIDHHGSLLLDIALPDTRSVQADNYDGSMSVSDWVSTNHRSPGRLPSRRLAIAAGILVALGAALLVSLNASLLRGPSSELLVLETVESEHRCIELEDGSRIELGAASALSVNFSDDRRTVVLEGGEALFEVAKDAERPFVVLAGSGTITAVGTAFNVQRDADRVVVTVTEGTVKVEQQSQGSNQAPIVQGSSRPPTHAVLAQATLAVGERAEYSTGGLTRLASVEPAVAIVWREGRLRYRAEPLKHVIADVDRYSPQQIIIGDVGVGELTFTGTVFQEKADEWLLGLEQVFPIELVPMDGDRLLLRSRASPESE